MQGVKFNKLILSKRFREGFKKKGEFYHFWGEVSGTPCGKADTLCGAANTLHGAANTATFTALTSFLANLE